MSIKVVFKNGNMKPIRVYDELTLAVILQTGSILYVERKNNGEVFRTTEEFIREVYKLNS